MKYKILDEFDRISLHDSHVEKIQYKEDSLIVEFDWGFLSNFKEIAVMEPIITGKSIFTFCSVIDEKFAEVVGFNKSLKIAKPKDFEANFKLIGTTEYKVEKDINIFSIGAFYGDISTSLFYQWDIYFKTATYEWDSYIRHAEWKEGKLPE